MLEESKIYMKKTLIIITHPDMEQSVVNQALIETIKNEKNITVHDLYENYKIIENLDYKKEQELLLEYEKIVFQFPLYWFSTPAMLKEWQDKVFEYGFAYGHEGTKLKNKEYQIVVTTGSLESAYSAAGKNKYTLDQLLLPLKASLDFIGMKFNGLFVVGGALNISMQELKINAEHYKKFILGK